ncbi:MAG: hypothetical protein J6U54_19735 [Clostridiales bacterium]|nr:hypothetical protein [Clostridiales bacterium]
MAEGLSSSDVALLSRDDGFGGMNAGFWIFALLLLNNGGFGGYGNRPGFVTEGELAASQNSQTQQLQINNLTEQVANNKFEMAQVVNQQTAEMVAQNNANMINAIQGFNNLGLQITNQTNVLSTQIQSLSAQMNECCCSIKTQMLQDRLADANAKIVSQQAELSNAQQTQYILNQLGRFVAWTPSGTQTASGN